MANKTGLIDKNGKELYFGETVIKEENNEEFTKRML